MARDTERLIVALEGRINDFEKKMARAEKRGTTTYQSLERGSRRASRRMQGDMNRSTRAINRALASSQQQALTFGRTFAAAFVGVGLTGFTAKVRSSVSELSEMAKVIDRVGLSAKVFQELQFGFELAGVAQSDFNTGMEQFNRRIGEASMGTGRLRDILDANGVALRDQNGTMRSTEALLRDYADLIANAGSEQEKMTLATEAFGRGGASFVNALQNGSAAFDDMADAAAEAGGVISDEVLDKAEDLDDRFASIARTIDIKFKGAVVGLIDEFNTLNTTITQTLERFGSVRSSFDEFVDGATWRPVGTAPPELPPGWTGGSGDGQPSVEDKPTIVPTKDDDDSARRRDAAARAAIREAEAVASLIDTLEFELSITGKSDVEREKAIKVRQAGSAATDQQREQISRLVDQIEAETRAIREAAEVSEFFGDISQDAFRSLIPVIETGNDALDRMIDKLIEAGLQAALLGQGPLASLFGGGGGGSLISSAIGAATGSAISPAVSSAIAGGVPGLWAEGGRVRGSGTDTSDNIPAWLSPGEYVVNAKAARKPGVLPWLEAINNQAAIGLASGGLVPGSEHGPEMIIGERP